MKRPQSWIRLTLAFLALAATTAVSAEEGTKLAFKKTRLDGKFRSEGVAVGDFNSDGKLDIGGGSVYYAAPDWKMIPVLEKPEEFDPHVYSKSFCDFAEDVNKDGRVDLIVVDFPGQQTWWFEQPAEAGKPWARHAITPVTNNESPSYLDVDGDGKRELLFGFDPGKFIGLARPTADPNSLWKLQAISQPNAPGTDRFSHGIGAGDVNGDGRNDIFVREGWWESPADKNQTAWVFHLVNFGEPCSQMYAFDFDGDGDNDLLRSSAHQIGIWWHEQKADGWQTHLIHDSFSQTHALVLVDMNGDKLPDFVTGKRWWAHGPKGDVGSDKDSVLYWFELTRQNGKPVWIPHQIDNDSGVGTQFEVADVNADGLLDIVTMNKKGAHYFEQVKQ